jgi:hypothetical protein
VAIPDRYEDDPLLVEKENLEIEYVPDERSRFKSVRKIEILVQGLVRLLQRVTQAQQSLLKKQWVNPSDFEWRISAA